MRGAVRATVLMACAAITSGCSFFLAKGPPPDHAERPYFYCTDTRTVPVIDLMGVGFYGLIGVVGATNNDAGAVVGLALGGLHTVGAFVGFQAVDRCREARVEQAARSAERDLAPDRSPSSHGPRPQERPPKTPRRK